MTPLLFGFMLVLINVFVASARATDDAIDDDFPEPNGCCDWPSCYDERTQLCLDTCRTTWTQCPKNLFLMTCYSEYMSPFGSLPLQCFPDAAPHMEEAEERGLSGSPKEVREVIHKLFNEKKCNARTGICRQE
eukprot:GFUD01020553.1.p1 GENE.GFUD01020553.1~~GFUD01020553.1.p1  ORF type:complete len:133 (-),score=18.14 GFUD01020553.1:206-604(-)